MEAIRLKACLRCSSKRAWTPIWVWRATSTCCPNSWYAWQMVSRGWGTSKSWLLSMDEVRWRFTDATQIRTWNLCWRTCGWYKQVHPWSWMKYVQPWSLPKFCHGWEKDGRWRNILCFVIVQNSTQDVMIIICSCVCSDFAKLINALFYCVWLWILLMIIMITMITGKISVIGLQNLGKGFWPIGTPIYPTQNEANLVSRYLRIFSTNNSPAGPTLNMEDNFGFVGGIPEMGT